MAREKNVRVLTKANSGRIQKERSHFKQLLAINPNYFGHLKDSKIKSVVKLTGNTQYEEITCIGFNPQTNFLEATIAIKLPYGYGGNLCMEGTTEYVRFFINYGSGWEDVGVAGVKVHDIPTGKDCANIQDKPLTYVASLRLDPKTDCCGNPVLPKVHAILSWELVPPAGPANVGWIPPWGNTLDCHIQIKPHPWNINCLFEMVSKSIGQKIDIPPLLEQAKTIPLPLPDPPYFTLADLAKQYSTNVEAITSSKGVQKVESHRFGVKDLHAALTSGVGSTTEMISENIAYWDSLGLDWSIAIQALNNTKANTSYEELECLGIDDIIPERLVATFRIKKPNGYSGQLCYPGSKEYVAFWVDWDNKCKWTYLNTVAVNVHDIQNIPADGLCYSAILPVDLSKEYQSCEKPKIARIRAVLSWEVPPSTTDPDKLSYWGNRLDAHVQINPGEQSSPEQPVIRNIGGIPIEYISTNTLTGNGMTIPIATFAHHPDKTADQWGLGRLCPFGGQIKIEGPFYKGYWYRIKIHNKNDPYSVFTVLDNSFKLERWISPPTYDTQTSVNGFFKYLDPTAYVDYALAYWNSTGDDKWDIQLDVATGPDESSIISSSDWYLIQLDNTKPKGPPAIPLTMDIHITKIGGNPMGLADCKDVPQGDSIEGYFIADDVHFGHWSLSTEPNTLTTPSNQPTVSGLAKTDPSPAPAGHKWSLSTSTPIMMHPCGYVVRLNVYDRSIVDSIPGRHNWNHIEVGFCLRAKGSP